MVKLHHQHLDGHFLCQTDCLSICRPIIQIGSKCFELRSDARSGNWPNSTGRIPWWLCSRWPLWDEGIQKDWRWVKALRVLKIPTNTRNILDFGISIIIGTSYQWSLLLSCFPNYIYLSISQNNLHIIIIIYTSNDVRLFEVCATTARDWSLRGVLVEESVVPPEIHMLYIWLVYW